MKKKVAAIAKSTPFEDALGELEQLVEKLESGDQSLEESLVQFERGMALSKFCQQALTEAESKVKILAGSETDEQALRNFEP